MQTTLIAPLARSLESVSDLDAALSRLIFSAHLVDGLSTWLPGLTVRCARTAEAAKPSDGKPRFGVTLRGGGSTLTLRLPWDIDPVSASVMGAGAWSSSVQLACLCARANGALPGLLDWLAEFDLYPVSLDRHPQGFVPASGAIAFECRFAGHRIEANLECHDAGWLARAGRQSARRRRPSMVGAHRLPLPVCVVLGQRRMSLRLLASLQVGDVLMLGRTDAADVTVDNGLLRIGHRGRGALVWPCRVQGRLITTTGDGWMSTETLGPMTASQEDVAAPAASPERGAGHGPMADLEGDVHLELQVLSTPLGELAAMQPGYVLELPVPAADAGVDLVVGGRIFGRAQLVRVGDRLGARLIEVFHDDA